MGTACVRKQTEGHQVPSLLLATPASGEPEVARERRLPATSSPQVVEAAQESFQRLS